MNQEDRKAAIAAYKERKTAAGIYTVRCIATGAQWVGGSLNLNAAHTSLWFQLRMKSHTYRDLQAAWNEHGAEAFTFAVLEQLKDDEDGSLRTMLLRKRAKLWGEELGAKVM
jgi:hypothetical protein